jgi:hypothetical protein
LLSDYFHSNLFAIKQAALFEQWMQFGLLRHSQALPQLQSFEMFGRCQFNIQ